MSKNVCIINLSAPEIQIAVLGDNQVQDINLRLPWEVGFQLEVDNTLNVCFGDEFKRLNSNKPTEVRFPDLDVKFKEITDEKTLGYLFDAFFEEIFHRQLPEQGYSIDRMSVYAITPYQWTHIHRQQLRNALKRVKSEATVSFLKSSNVTLRGLLSQTLCLAAYYQTTLEEILTDRYKCYLFMIDFGRNDFVVYQTICSQLENNVTVELTNMLRFTDYFMDMDKKVSGVQKALQKVGDELPIAISFSGRIDDTTRTIIRLLHDRCSATFLETQEAATLLGGSELVQQFQENNLGKPLHFVYNYCFGVRLPEGNMVELIPKTWVPPYHRKKAFRFTGSPKKFDVHLYCGLSMTENSDVHRLVTLEIDPLSNRVYTSRSPYEFMLCVTLNDDIHGTFTAILPNQKEKRSIEFTIPILMD